jgi:hypothetical protein
MNVNVTQKNPDLFPCPICGCKLVKADWGTGVQYYNRSWQHFYIDCASSACDFGVSINIDDASLNDGISTHVEEVLKQTWNGIAAVMVCRTTP